MSTYDIGIHIRDKYAKGIIGLTFMFERFRPIEIDVSWVNCGDELEAVKNIMANLTSEKPNPCEIDEEGHFATITPTTISDEPDKLLLHFKSDREEEFEPLTITVSKQQFHDEFQRAIQSYLALPANKNK